MSAWSGKPCARCDGRKGQNYRTNKHCGRCAPLVKREQRERAHRKHVADTYNILAGDYDRLYDAQGGKCAICRRATGKTRRLSVDHCHKCGDVRGLLCRPCNDLLGFARDDPEFFLRAIDYLLSPPAASLLRLAVHIGECISVPTPPVPGDRPEYRGSREAAPAGPDDPGRASA